MNDLQYGRVLSEPEDTYRNSGCVGSSELNCFIRNEALWAGIKDGTFPPRGDTPALNLGRAVHAYVLEGVGVFNERFAVGGPINEKTGKCYGTDTQAYAKWAAEQGKPCLSYADRDQIVRMAMAVKQNPEAVKWLRGLHEVTYRVKLDGLGVQCRCDTINEGERWISDLKTTESLEKFKRSFIGLGYARQAALYRMVTSRVLGLGLTEMSFVFVVVEKNPPYAVAVYKTSDQLALLGEAEVDKALARMRAIRDGAKPVRDPDGIQTISCPEYMLEGLALGAEVDEF